MMSGHLLCLPTTLQHSQPPDYQMPGHGPLPQAQSPTLGPKFIFVCVIESAVTNPDLTSTSAFSDLPRKPLALTFILLPHLRHMRSTFFSVNWCLTGLDSFSFGSLLILGLLGIKAQLENWCSKWQFNSLQFDLQIQCNQVKILARLFVAISKLTLKFSRKDKGTRTAKIIPKKNKVRALTFPDFKTYYKATSIRAVQLWQKADMEVIGTEYRAQK